MLIPWQNGIGPFYDRFFGDLGTSPTEVVGNSIRHPTETWQLPPSRIGSTWYWHMLAPWAFVPLLDSVGARVAAGTIFIDVVTVVPVHARLPVPLLRDRRRRLRGRHGRGDRVDIEPRRQRNRTITVMVTAVVAAAAIASRCWGAAPYSRN